MFLLPIEKHNPLLSPSRVVPTCVALNILVFIAQQFGTEAQIFQHFGFVCATPHILSSFSHMFLHGGVMHLLGNMFFLWMFGDNVEDVLGRFTFIGAYLLCGMGALAAQYVSNPASAVPMVGASGAISGVVALYLIFFPKAPFKLVFLLGRWTACSWSVRCKVAVLAWFVEQLLLAAITSMTHSIGIAFWAHVGGFATGIVVGGVLLLLGWKERFDLRVAAVTPATQKVRQAAASS